MASLKSHWLGPLLGPPNFGVQPTAGGGPEVVICIPIARRD